MLSNILTIEERFQRDAILEAEFISLCASARTAVAQFRAMEARLDDGAKLELEFEEATLTAQATIERVAAVRALTPRAIAAKAELLDDYLSTMHELEPETREVTLAVSLAEDARALAGALTR